MIASIKPEDLRAKEQKALPNEPEEPKEDNTI